MYKASLESQGHFVRHVVLHPVARRFPPSREYRQHLLRMYIDAISKTSGEYDDELMSLYTSLLSSSKQVRWATSTLITGNTSDFSYCQTKMQK